MRFISIKVKILFFTSISLIYLSACKKNEEIKVDNETQSVVDYAIADQEFLSLVVGVCQAANNTQAVSSITTYTLCDTLKYSSGNVSTFNPNPVFVTDVSSGYCSSLMPDSKVRTGNVSAMFTGKISDVGSNLTIKLSNYTSSGISYTCDSMLVSVEEVTADQSSYKIKLINGYCKTSNYSINYEFDRTLLIHSNSNGLAIISGTSKGRNRLGKSFSTRISANGLKKYRNCSYIAEGLMELTPEGFKARQIDFGNGVCDDLATYSVNENTVAFKLK